MLHRADRTGQTALHWAAVRGSLLAGETLLSHGADLRLQDGRGYTACHVAAQYGQTAFIFMCALRWRADVDWCAAPCCFPETARKHPWKPVMSPYRATNCQTVLVHINKDACRSSMAEGAGGLSLWSHPPERQQ